MVNEPHELASNMLAYQDGYPSLMAFEPHATSQPAATAMECFQQCDSTDGCQAWTTVAGLPEVLHCSHSAVDTVMSASMKAYAVADH